MTVTLLFNGMRGVSRFRLWRIDSARDKLEAQVEQLTKPGLTREQMRAAEGKQAVTEQDSTTDVRAIADQLGRLRLRCQRYTSSVVTPMGDEMFYRYQEALIDELTKSLTMLLERSARQPPSKPLGSC